MKNVRILTYFIVAYAEYATCMLEFWSVQTVEEILVTPSTFFSPCREEPKKTYNRYTVILHEWKGCFQPEKDAPKCSNYTPWTIKKVAVHLWL